jgi:REP element-mobilizing transposase RayT
LPRLPPEWYRGDAVVFWTHTIAHRRTGWLDASLHAAFREVMLHAAAREKLLCPMYTLMPDHVHLIWMGVNTESNQRAATSFLREQIEPHLVPVRWQHQPHDRVLRDEERKHGAFASTCHYIADNPVRAGLVATASAWSFTGCIVPGHPKRHPLADDFWDKFWRIYAAAIARGAVGKIGNDASLWLVFVAADVRRPALNGPASLPRLLRS